MKIRIYFTPFVTGEIYGEEVEVTNFVQEQSISRLRQQVDQSEYDIGIFKFQDTNIIMNNQSGKFGQPGDGISIFGVRRTGSKVRITWELEDDDVQCNNAFVGDAFLSETKTIFKGTLNDEASTEDIQTQTISFKIMGREAVFSQVEAPTGDYTLADTFKELMVKSLVSPLITNLFTVDADNINPPVDLVIDLLDQWVGATVKKVFDDLLLVSNSILYIRDDTIFIVSRDPSAESKFTFFGPTSEEGIENIQDLSKVRFSLNKTFNFWQWDDFIIRGAASIASFGVRKKAFSFDGITDNGKKGTILTALQDEFSLPVREFDLTTPATYETIELFIGDQVRVDYPTIFFTSEGNQLPYYDRSKYDEAVYPAGEFSITIDKEVPHKIMGRTFDLKKKLITFKIRET